MRLVSACLNEPCVSGPQHFWGTLKGSQRWLEPFSAPRPTWGSLRPPIFPLFPLRLEELLTVASGVRASFALNVQMVLEPMVKGTVCCWQLIKRHFYLNANTAGLGSRFPFSGVLFSARRGPCGTLFPAVGHQRSSREVPVSPAASSHWNNLRCLSERAVVQSSSCPVPSCATSPSLASFPFLPGTWDRERQGSLRALLGRAFPALLFAAA